MQQTMAQYFLRSMLFIFNFCICKFSICKSLNQIIFRSVFNSFHVQTFDKWQIRKENDFVEISKILVKYWYENNFIGLESKYMTCRKFKHVAKNFDILDINSM